LVVALLGGTAPAVLSALLSGVLLNYFLLAPRRDFAIAEHDAAVTEVVLLLVAVAVAALVDGTAKRSREAGHASREAELMTLFAGAVLRGADLGTLLERVRETYMQRSVSLVRVPGGAGAPEVVSSVGTNPCTSVDLADTAIEVGDDEFWMLMVGRQLASRDRPVLSVVARQAAGLVRQEELTAEAGRADAVMRTDELRRSLLSAVSHDLRTPLAAAKAAVSSLRADDVAFSPDDTAELLATVEESVDQLTDLVGNLLDSSRLAAGVIRPELTKVYLEEVVQRSLIGIGKRSNAFGRRSLDQVKVDVGPTVAMADAGLLERVLANVIDNALRYASESMVRVTAVRVGDRALINVADDGRGLPKGGDVHMFDPFQRLGDRDNTSGVGLGLSVARGFVEAMGGTIAATETPGGGLTMVVDLAAPTGEG
ncbi:MAG TPA: ATP-binding protein, partial [Mycobacterium sp.]|nr:ATP-binding protein [Mycobacterium sp.]